jgi:hypothetical protein
MWLPSGAKGGACFRQPPPAPNLASRYLRRGRPTSVRDCAEGRRCFARSRAFGGDPAPFTVSRGGETISTSFINGAASVPISISGRRTWPKGGARSLFRPSIDVPFRGHGLLPRLSWEICTRSPAQTVPCRQIRAWRGRLRRDRDTGRCPIRQAPEQQPVDGITLHQRSCGGICRKLIRDGYPVLSSRAALPEVI